MVSEGCVFLVSYGSVGVILLVLAAKIFHLLSARFPWRGGLTDIPAVPIRRVVLSLLGPSLPDHARNFPTFTPSWARIMAICRNPVAKNSSLLVTFSLTQPGSRGREPMGMRRIRRARPGPSAVRA